MAKLKKFNNRSDYISFLGTSEFTTPDISAIGTGSDPTNWDVEFNPVNAFLLNNKSILHTSATTLPFILDTNTNGKVNVWWRPSTGGTYTKISSSDLTFNSGYTVAKTVLTVNTPARSTSYNNDYIISAVSITSSSVFKTTTCTQIGLITLSAPSSSFDSGGGTLTAQVNTAPGNKWKITNIPSWLSFAQTTGTGPTTINVTAASNPDSMIRTATVTIGYIDIDYSVTSETFTQQKRDDLYFVFLPSSANVSSGASNSYSISYEASGSTVGSAVTLSSSESWLILNTTQFTADTSGTITFSYTANPNRTSRTATITAVISGTTSAVFTLIQASQETYFYVSTVSSDNAKSTSGTSVSFTINSADTSNKTVYYATNYTTSEIQALTFDTSSFTDGNTATMGTSGTFTFSMNAKSIVIGGTASVTSPVLRVKNGTTTIGTVNITHNAAAYFGFEQTSVTDVTGESTTLTNNITTNIPSSSLSLTSSPSISTYSFNSIRLSYTIPANSSAINSRTFTLTAKWGSTTLQSFTVQQNAKVPSFELLPDLVNLTTDAQTGYTYLSTNVSDSEISSFNLSVSSDSNWLTITSSSLINNGHINFSISENTSTDERSGKINLYSNSTLKDYSIVKQDGAIPKFIYITSEGNTSESYSVNSAGTSSKSYIIITNYEQSELNAMTKNKPSWVNNLSLTTSSISFGVDAQSVGASSRNGNITFGGITISVSQSKGEDFNMTVKINNATSPSAISASTSSFGISIATNSSKSYNIYVNGSSFSSATGNYSGTYNCGQNTGQTASRTFSVTVSNSDISGSASITQNGVAESVTLYLNNTHSNITINSGDTSFSVKVVPSANDFYYNVKVDGTTQWSNLSGTTTNTYTCGANPTNLTRSFTVKVESTNSSEQFTVIQDGKESFKANLRVNNSTSPDNIGSGVSSFTISTTPNDSSQSYIIKVDSISVTSTTGNYSSSYSCNANPNTSNRTMTVYVYVGSTVVETVSIVQYAKAYYTIQSTKYIDGNSYTNVTLTADTNMVGTFYVTDDGNSWHSTPTISSDGKTITVSRIDSYTSSTDTTRSVSCSIKYNSAQSESIATGTITQNPVIVLVPNLRVNTSTSPDNIGSGVSSFTISTTPNAAYTSGYTIYVNGDAFTSTTGNYSGTYTCGENPNVNSNRTFEVTCGNESVTIIQNRKQFYINLRVNSSTSPENINSTATGFTISTTPNDSSQSYTIYINGNSYTSTTGNYSETYNCGANTNVSSRTFTVSASNSLISDSVNITQNGVAESVTLYLNDTHSNITINSGDTSFSIKVVPSANDFYYSVKINGTTQWSNLSGTTTNTYNCGANPNTTNRTFTVKVESPNSSEQLTVTQSAKEAFKANLSVSSTLIGSATTGFTISTAPNDSSQSYSIYVDSTSVTSTTGNYSGTYNCGENTSTSNRTMRVAVKVGTSIVEYIDVTQDAKAYYTIQSTKYIDGNSQTNVTLTADTNMVGTFYVTGDGGSWHSTPTISSNGKTITLSSINSYTSTTTSTRAITCVVRYNTTTGEPLAVGTIAQSPTIVLVPNLRVNNSTNPNNIGSADTSFTISTTPNAAYTGSYTIYINGTSFTSTTGNYSGSYTCGENTDVSTNRTFTVTCGNESVSITQNRKQFYSNLRVNSSTNPGNIGSGATGFTISATPNATARYNVYVNDVLITDISGNYSSTYNCGANPDTSERTFTVKTNFNGNIETVTIKQNPKYVAQTRIVQVAGSGAQWSVNMTPSRVTAGCDISFNISVSDATGTITGSVYGDNPGITVTTDMNGTIELRTTTLSAFDLTLDLNIESGGPRFGIYPYSGNVYGFNSGEIGGGVGGYHTYGTIPIKAGEPDSVTRESLDDMTWELADD